MRRPGLAAGFAILLAAGPGAGDDPGVAERQRLERGESVRAARTVAGWPWPELVLWRVLAAAPDEVMAVYADFGAHAEWAPRVLQSRVGAAAASGALRVAYEYDTIGPNERYIVEVRVRRDSAAWEAAWELVKARYARRLSGRLRTEPHPGGTLVTYVTRVDPGALGSPASTAERLEATLDALARRVARLRADSSALAPLLERLGALTR